MSLSKFVELYDLFSSAIKTKVFVLLLKHGQLALTKIVKETNTTSQICEKHLNHFIEMGMVNVDVSGEKKIYKARLDIIEVLVLANFVKLWPIAESDDEFIACHLNFQNLLKVLQTTHPHN